MSGLFIALEGIEGSGKSTQAMRLRRALQAHDREARQTREPGGTPLAEAIRAVLLHPEAARAALETAGLVPRLAADDAWEAAEAMAPMTEVFLLSAARTQHVAHIRAWLAAGVTVITDRYAGATLAYQGYARGLDLEALRLVERLATGGLAPDLTLLFDLEPAEGQRRKTVAHQGGGELNRIDRETLAFHARVRAGYLALAAEDPERWVVLDARLSQDDLAGRVWQAVSERLGAG